MISMTISFPEIQVLVQCHNLSLYVKMKNIWPETFKTIVVNKLEISKIKLYFSTDLRQNEESLDKTLVEFKTQKMANTKWKM